MDPLGAHDPKRVGPYRLLGRLGAGGMGQVFLGRDRRGELVAVKVVHPGFAHDEQFRLRFRREVEVSRRVTGPWVAAVVDADPDARVPWLATQYVRGPSLSAAVDAHGPLPVGQAHLLAHGLAAGLAAVHEAGLVHRDLKPSNVLLGTDNPRLIDFGISRAVDDTRVTSTGMVVGTPAYMSPEQIAGEDVGPASDVFSLGSVLAYAATGRSPFGEHPPVVLMMRISGHEPDLDGLPDVLRAPIAACLAKRPEDRPTAAELGGTLGTFVARGPGWPPAEVAALGTAPDRSTVPDAQAVAASAEAPQLSRRAWLAIFGAIGLTAAGGFGLAAAYGPGPRAAAAPQWRWTATITSWPGAPSVIVDETTVFVYSGDGTHPGVLVALDSATGDERWSVPGWAPHSWRKYDATMVSAGGFLAVGTGTAVAAFEARTGRRRWEAAQPGPVAAIAAADGVVVAATDTSLLALDVVSGGRIWGSEPDLYLRTSRVVVHDGVCFSSHAHRIDARDLRTGRVLWSHESGSPEAPLLTAADDVVAAGFSDSVVALDAATGGQRWSTPLALVTDSPLDLAAVGDVVVAQVENAAEVKVVRALDLATGAPRWALPDSGEIGRQKLLGVDEIVYVRPGARPTRAYDAATGEPRWTYRGDSGIWEPIAARGHDAYLFDTGAEGQLQAVTSP